MLLLNTCPLQNINIFFLKEKRFSWAFFDSISSFSWRQFLFSFCPQYTINWFYILNLLFSCKFFVAFNFDIWPRLFIVFTVAAAAAAQLAICFLLCSIWSFVLCFSLIAPYGQQQQQHMWGKLSDWFCSPYFAHFSLVFFSGLSFFFLILASKFRQFLKCV